MLFTEFVRTDDRRKTNRESDFEFMDRSARSEIARVRDFLEDLAGGYPKTELKDLVARIQSGNNVEFRSATFELCLHAFLVKIGYALEPHPKLDNGLESRPDFHVVAPDGSEFYLEAVLASPDDGANPGADARIGTALDILAQASHQNFYVDIKSKGVPKSQPSGKRLLRDTVLWLDSLDPDEILELINLQGYKAAPSMAWAHEGWNLTLRPIPIKQERRGRATTLVGILDQGGGRIDEWTPIRNAVKRKAGKYGYLDKPLLIAVNFASLHLDRVDEMQALYGQEQFLFNPADPSMQPIFGRASNGAWRGPEGPRGRRASGVWLFNDLHAHNVATRRQTVYFNPWAFHALPECLNQMPHATLRGDKMRWQDGVSLRDVFGLPG
jgi:hypothetical protein